MIGQATLWPHGNQVLILIFKFFWIFIEKFKNEFLFVYFMDNKDLVFLVFSVFALIVVGAYFFTSVTGYAVYSDVEEISASYGARIVSNSIILLGIISVAVLYFVKRKKISKK